MGMQDAEVGSHALRRKERRLSPRPFSPLFDSTFQSRTTTAARCHPVRCAGRK